MHQNRLSSVVLLKTALFSLKSCYLTHVLFLCQNSTTNYVFYPMVWLKWAKFSYSMFTKFAVKGVNLFMGHPVASSRRIESTCLNFGDCLVGVWRVFENCQEGVWQVSGGCLEGFLRASGSCLLDVRRVCGVSRCIWRRSQDWWSQDRSSQGSACLHLIGLILIKPLSDRPDNGL